MRNIEHTNHVQKTEGTLSRLLAYRRPIPGNRLVELRPPSRCRDPVDMGKTNRDDGQQGQWLFRRGFDVQWYVHGSATRTPASCTSFRCIGDVRACLNELERSRYSTFETGIESNLLLVREKNYHQGEIFILGQGKFDAIELTSVSKRSKFGDQTIQIV